jgi:hypothetical protein
MITLSILLGILYFCSGYYLFRTEFNSTNLYYPAYMFFWVTTVCIGFGILYLISIYLP